MPSTSVLSVLATAVPRLDHSYLLNLTLSLQAPCECPDPSWASSEALCRRGSVDLGHRTHIGPPWMVHSLRAAGAERTPLQQAPSTRVTSEYRCEPLGLCTWTLSWDRDPPGRGWSHHGHRQAGPVFLLGHEFMCTGCLAFTIDFASKISTFRQYFSST